MQTVSADETASRRWLWLLPVLALILSVTCVSSSTFLALSLWPTEISHAQMLAESSASYERDPSALRFAPVSTQIIFEATNDSLGLQVTPLPATPEPSGVPVADNPVQLMPTLSPESEALPTAIVITLAPTTSLPASDPFAEPDTPTPWPTMSPVPTEPIVAATATATAASTATPELPADVPPTATETAVPATATFTTTPSPLPSPSAVPTQPPAPLATPTFTPIPTVTPPPLPPTRTPPPLPPTFTPTATATATPLPTNTPTSSPTATHTPTPSPTPTATNTPGPLPCTGNIPAGEPDLGLPDGSFASIGCGQTFVVDLGAANVIDVVGGDSAFDLVYYENENPALTVNLDWVILEVSTSATGPWYPIFYWGDNNLDAHTNIGQLGYGAAGENDNHPIPFSDLYGGNSTGIAIDLDAVVPAGSYQWLRITSPLGGDNDAAEVDAIKTLP